MSELKACEGQHSLPFAPPRLFVELYLIGYLITMNLVKSQRDKP
jgi:hypothetical protein